MDRPFSNNDIQRFVIRDGINKRFNIPKKERNSMILKENVQSQGSVYDFTNYSTLNNFIDNQNNNIFLGQSKEFKSPISTNQSVLSQNLDNINEYKYIRKNNNQYSKLRKTYDFQHSGLKNKKH